MITFKQDNTRFTYRVAGIAFHNNAVLFEQSSDKTYWNLPGGRVELREPSSEALIREMREELGITITIIQSLYIVEHFFTHNGTFHQTLGFYFLMTFPQDAYLYTTPGPFTRSDNNQELTFAWLPLAELEHFPVYPTFLRKGLQSLPEERPLHIIHREDNTV